MAAWLGIYLRGFCMGAADAVPGVSGGTIALITGIYERLIDAIAGLRPGDAAVAIPLAVRSYDADARRALRDLLVERDVPFLLVLGVGVISAVLTLANVVEYLRHQYPALLFAFFFGLIAASVLVLSDEFRLQTPTDAALALIGAGLAFVVSGAASGSIGASLAILFASGAIAICAMVLPGISGSLILLALGQYTVMTGAVHDLTAGVVGALDGETVDAVVEPLTTLVVFAVGALVGLLTFARIVSWALDEHPGPTMTFLVALMAGSLRAPADRIAANVADWTPGVAAVLLVAGALGAAAVLGLDQVTGDISY